MIQINKNRCLMINAKWMQFCNFTYFCSAICLLKLLLSTNEKYELFLRSSSMKNGSHLLSDWVKKPICSSNSLSFVNSSEDLMMVPGKHLICLLFQVTKVFGVLFWLQIRSVVTQKCQTTMFPVLTMAALS